GGATHAPAAASALPDAATDHHERSAHGAALAERFMAEFAKSMRAAPTVLPIPFRPMAEAITGSNRVLLSTDTASRRALRAVGKQAATTGDTIHLDASPTELLTPGARITEIVAHELTHV